MMQKSDDHQLRHGVEITTSSMKWAHWLHRETVFDYSVNIILPAGLMTPPTALKSQVSEYVSLK